MRETALTTATGNEISDAVTPLLNDVVRGSVDNKGFPTIRSRSGGWRSASFLIGVEVAERFSYNGISSNLISYLTGPLGLSTAAAAANVNAWNGAAMLLPLVGGFVADAYLGRYRTVVIATLLYILGLGFLSLSAALHSSNSSPTLEVVSFFFSLYLVAFAEGGHKPCLQAFGADQFDDQHITESKAKSSFFNWWYFSANAGVLVALFVLNYIQENLSWGLGFGIPCIVMCLSLIVFLLGSRTYRFHVKGDDGNSLSRIFLVFVRAARNWKADPRKEIMSDGGTRFKFLDKALLTPDDMEEDKNVCTAHDIEDASAILRLIPIWWCACLGYAIIFAQASTLFTKQGATMDRHIVSGVQIPSATLQSLINLSIVVFIPIYDRVLVPLAGAITKRPSGISMLQRIGTGMALSLLCVVVEALVERRRLAIAVESGLIDSPDSTVPMSVWWLAPQYLLYGIAEVFTMIGLQEFFYDQVPIELRSVGLGLYLTIFGIGNFLSSFLISIIEMNTSQDGGESWFSNNLNRAHLDYFYWVLAGISVVTMVAYVYFSKSYVYRKNVEG